MLNATTPFLAASSNDSQPLPDLQGGPVPYGFNILLLSNTSAAALDGPDRAQVSKIQYSLMGLNTSATLSATVRATVVQYNSTAESHRDDKVFWAKYFDVLSAITYLEHNWTFGILGSQNPARDAALDWDHSWIFVGSYPSAGLNDDKSRMQAFQQIAMGFDIKRHNCTGRWRITRSSIELIYGRCTESPLEPRYQYLENCQLDASRAFSSVFAALVRDFVFTRHNSHWLIPLHTVLIASIYQSQVAASSWLTSLPGTVRVQPNGSFERLWRFMLSKDSPIEDGVYNISYPVSDARLITEVSILKDNWSLYFILAIQSILIILTFVATTLLHATPVSRGFGLPSVLAGIDRSGIDMLNGSGFSGELRKPVRLEISVSERSLNSDENPTLSYVLGGRGRNSRVQIKQKYS